MEFIQFHPTALYPTEDPAFLISEALRGEGAVLRCLDGRPLMESHHALGSLAPRDIVARVIDREMRDTGEPHVLLDVSAIPRSELESRFPGAVEGCLTRGVDLFGKGIPVVPAAHYVCGGVVTDASGETGLQGLYAAGEVACTGIHGANRLASNSLLEAVVFSHRAARAVLERLARPGGRPGAPLPLPVAEIGTPAPGLAPSPEVAQLRAELRALMWTNVGIVRSDGLLEEAEHQVGLRRSALEAQWRTTPCTPEGIELRNLLLTAELIVRCARLRGESRGLHFNLDHPWRDSEAFLRDTILRP
jgi:L-aspartate oxidase